MATPALETYERFTQAAERAEEHNQPERAAELQSLADMVLGNRQRPDDTFIIPTTPGNSEIGEVASTIQPLPLSWGWKGVLPYGELVWFFGKGSVGKGLFMAKLTALVTQGLPMPDGTPGMHGCVVVISPEDNPQTALVPRLIAAGADLSKVFILNTVERDVSGSGDASKDNFTLPDDVPVLRKLIEKINAAKEEPVCMVIIDNLMAVANEGVSLYRNQTVRKRVVGPLEQLGDDLGIVLCMVAHVNKGKMADFLDNANGSKGITDAGRLCYGIVPNPNNPDRQAILFCAKTNIGQKPTPITYEKEIVWVPEIREYAATVKFISGFDESILAEHRKNVLNENQQKIKELLESHERCFDPLTIHQKCKIDSYNVTRTTLYRMVEKGWIAYPARESYCSLEFEKTLQERAKKAKEAEATAQQQPANTIPAPVEEKSDVTTVTTVTTPKAKGTKTARIDPQKPLDQQQTALLDEEEKA